MKKRSIASRLSRCCGRGLGKKWKLLDRRRLRQAHQSRKERKRLSSTPSSQLFNQRSDRVVASRIRWQHQWRRARCVLRAVRWGDKSCAEFWEEFLEAVVAGDNCSHVAARRLLTAHKAMATTKKIAGRISIHARRSELRLIISLAKPPGSLLLSSRPCLPSLGRRWPTWCK